MPSPFPGMDPWLEQHWGDVRTRLVTYCSDRLQGGLPRDLRARVEERLSLEWEGEQVREVVSDVRVVEFPREGSVRVGAASMLQPSPVLRIGPRDEQATDRLIEIRDHGTDGRLVTVIEIYNVLVKGVGRALQSLQRKRQELRSARVNLIEIDLLRGGRRIEPIPRAELRKDYDTPYLVTACRETGAGSRYEYEIYRVPLEDRLPVIAVPLRRGDPDALLDLQAVLNDAYDRGGYDIIDYRKPPKPPLEGAAAEWADQLLKQKGLR